MRKLTIIIEDKESNRASNKIDDVDINLKTQISPKEYELICELIDKLNSVQVNHCIHSYT